MYTNTYENIVRWTVITVIFLMTSCSETPEPSSPPVTNPPISEEPGDTPGGGNVPTSILEIDNGFSSASGFSSRLVALQNDRKILIDAYISDQNGTSSRKIYRLNYNGSIDETFNIDIDRSWQIKSITGLFALSGNRVLVGGNFVIDGKTEFIVRLEQNGALDRNYRTYQDPGNGIILSVRNPPEMVRTADNKVFLIVPYDTQISAGYDNNSLVRLNDDGTVDESFNFSMYPGNITSVIPLLNGKIVISGRFVYYRNGLKRYDLAVLNEDGSLDENFNFSLEQRTNFNTPLSATVDSEGRILIAGTFDRLTDQDIRDTFYDYKRVARINSNGSIDESYKGPQIMIGRGAAELYTFRDNTLMIRAYDGGKHLGDASFYFFEKDGGEIPNLNFGFPAVSVSNIFRESKENDQYLFLGEIPVGNQKHPVVRLKKN